MSYDNIKRMIEVSLEKKTMLNSILSHTKDQMKAIDADDMDGLSKIIAEKEILMEKIDILDKEFMLLYDKIKLLEGIDSLEKLNSEKFTNVKALRTVVNDIFYVLNEISIKDRNNTIKMKTNVDTIKSDLKQVREVKRAYEKYNYEDIESILIDEKK